MSNTSSSKTKRGRPKGRSSDQRSFGPLGDLIRTARLGKKLGLAEVAKACACSVQFISNIEHGRAPLPWEKVAPLANFLKVAAGDIQAANLAIRSDFRSFMTTPGKKVKTPAALLNGGATAVAASARDPQLHDLIQRYTIASQSNRKKFYRAALKLLGE